MVSKKHQCDPRRLTLWLISRQYQLDLVPKTKLTIDLGTKKWFHARTFNCGV